MFNISETFARFNRDYKIKFSTGINIFLTRFSTETMPGMFRLLLNLNNQSKGTDTRIYGPNLLVPFLEKIKFRFGIKTMLCSFYSTFTNQVILGFKTKEERDKFFEVYQYESFYQNTNKFLRENYTHNYA